MPEARDEVPPIPKARPQPRTGIEDGTHSKKRGVSCSAPGRVRIDVMKAARAEAAESAGGAVPEPSPEPPSMPPRPRRDPPYFVQEAHEVQVGDHLDVDWTLHWDWGEEQRRREVRNKLIQEKAMYDRFMEE